MVAIAVLIVMIVWLAVMALHKPALMMDASPPISTETRFNELAPFVKGGK